MGDFANQAAQNTLDQITGFYKETDSSSTFSMKNIGMTPMTGVEDVKTNISTLDDAITLKHFSEKNDVGMISIWKLGRY